MVDLTCSGENLRRTRVCDSVAEWWNRQWLVVIFIDSA